MSKHAYDKEGLQGGSFHADSFQRLLLMEKGLACTKDRSLGVDRIRTRKDARAYARADTQISISK
jgi:hypothetical protein